MNRTHTAQIIRAVPSAGQNPPEEASPPATLGRILVDAGRLSPTDAQRIDQAMRDRATGFAEAGSALRLVSDDDVRYALSVQFGFPYVDGDSRLDRSLVAAYHPETQEVEQLRALRSQLMLRWFDAGHRRHALSVVSAAQGEGRSYIAANLAIVFSQLGERTLLIDADMRSPSHHRLFDLGHRAGLSDMLARRAGPEAVARIPELPNLSVLAAGTVPPNPQELLERQGFGALLDAFADEYSFILIDTPPASQCADAQTVAVRAGAALIVARQNRSSMPQMARFAQSLRDFGVTLVGSVLNDA